MKKWLEYIGLVGLWIWTIAVWFGARKLGFVNWDDPEYILENPWLSQPENVWRIFYMGNYHPVTLLSLALDNLMWGKNPIGWHSTQLFLHAINVGLLFAIARKLNLSYLTSLSIALIWSVMPVHVEPVSWLSSRKDLLYTCFGFSALLAYAYSRHKDKFAPFFYSLSLLFFVLACLSKAMAVILTVWIILLFHQEYLRNGSIRKLFFHILPFFLISLFFGGLAWMAQADTGAIQESLGIARQLLLAGQSMVFLLLQTIFPYELSPFYPYPDELLMPGLVSWAILSGLGLLVWKYRWKMPGVSDGLLLFLSGILPVSQLIPVGIALTADRYAYFASAGLLIGLVPFLQQKITKPTLFLSFVGVCVGVFVMRIQKQLPVWHSGVALFAQVTQQYPQAAFAWSNLGTAYATQGDVSQAEICYRRTLAADSTYKAGYQNLTTLLYDRQQFPEAGFINQLAIRRFPEDKATQLMQFRLSCIPACTKQQVSGLMKWLQEFPHEHGAWAILGEHYRAKHQYASAQACFSLAYQLNPHFENYQISLAMMMAEVNRAKEADSLLSQLLLKKPQDVVLLANLAWVKYRAFEYARASQLNLQAIQQAPQAGILKANQVIYEWKNNRPADAKKYYAQFLELSPDSSTLQQARIDFLQAGIQEKELVEKGE
jgi:tetratricopeptide (TPR) repeat protein